MSRGAEARISGSRPRAVAAARPCVLLVDLDRRVRGGARSTLAEYEVVEAVDADDARAAMCVGDHVAWLIAVEARDSIALELLARARQDGRDTSALVTCTRASSAIANRAQLLGAEFLCKPYSAANLRAFFERALAARPVHVAERIAASTRLSQRETDVVRLIARGTARSAFAAELALSENTVKTIVRNLLHKTRCVDVDDLRCRMLRRA